MTLSNEQRAWLHRIGLTPEDVLKMSGQEFGQICRAHAEKSSSAELRTVILETLDWAAQAVNDPTGGWRLEAERALDLVNPLDWEPEDLDPEIVGGPLPPNAESKT